jgi:hypothetical protein
MKREMPKGRRALTASLIALALATGVAAFAIGVVLPALLAAEAEHIPNYSPDYQPAVSELEAAKLAARLEQENRRAAEAEVARLKAERALEKVGDHFPNHVHGEPKPEGPTQAASAPGVSRPGSTPKRADTDDPLLGLDSL